MLLDFFILGTVQLAGVYTCKIFYGDFLKAKGQSTIILGVLKKVNIWYFSQKRNAKKMRGSININTVF